MTEVNAGQHTLLHIHLHDFSSHVVSALGTDDVCRHGGTAFGAVRPLDGRFTVVRTACTGSGVAVFSFRDCHDSPKILIQTNKLPVSYLKIPYGQGEFRKILTFFQKMSWQGATAFAILTGNSALSDLNVGIIPSFPRRRKPRRIRLSKFSP